MQGPPTMHPSLPVVRYSSLVFVLNLYLWRCYRLKNIEIKNQPDHDDIDQHARHDHNVCQSPLDGCPHVCHFTWLRLALAVT